MQHRLTFVSLLQFCHLSLQLVRACISGLSYDLGTLCVQWKHRRLHFVFVLAIHFYSTLNLL